MTANAFAEDVQRCLDAGMDAHIAKPIDRRTLKEVMYRIDMKQKAVSYESNKEFMENGENLDV